VLLAFSVFAVAISKGFRTHQKEQVARTHHLFRTLSQNGYGDGCTAHPKRKPIFGLRLPICTRRD